MRSNKIIKFRIIMSIFKDKVLLITGGTGSFGNAVLRRFLDSDIKEIRILSRDEKKQDDMRHRLQNPKVKYFIGDVRNKESVDIAMRGVDYVFSAAALKQVPSCEFFPMEATRTNVLRGYVDGRLWIMNYEDSYDDLVIGDEIYHNEGIPYLQAYCIDEEYLVVDTLGMDETNINNLCDRESAEGLAKQFLSRLGMSNMELLHIVHNDIWLTEKTSTVDGYTMIFGMSENGAHLLFSYGACEANMVPTNEQNIFAAQPYVEVQVNSNGVYGIVIRGNYNKPEIMSEETTMLSFDQINEVAKEELANTVTRDIGSIEFGYVYITYDGLSYAIVPVWRYYEVGSERDTTDKTPALTICALDGSIIYNDNLGAVGPFAGTIPY